jgi:hypothetical protein
VQIAIATPSFPDSEKRPGFFTDNRFGLKLVLIFLTQLENLFA